MIYRDFLGEKVSLLGFGTMRLPQHPEGDVDEALASEMIRYAMKQGINYYDTAYPYHNGESERILGKVLNEYPRDQFYLADKFPGHQVSDTYDPAPVFQEQLEKCQVDYFDFYLLHNIYENSIETYLDPKWDIVNYFKEQKRLGKIKHLGFSCHGSPDILKKFLDACDGAMEFCQLQINYLDWTLQDAKGKYEFLTEQKIPVLVMEPVRGGGLAKLSDSSEARLKEMRPEESIPAWSFRFLQTLPNVKTILSGMSSPEQLKDNLRTFHEEKSLSKEETALLFRVAEEMKDSIPCTACRYCCGDCPLGLDIPLFLSIYNEIRVTPAITSAMRLEGLSKEKRPEACIQCGTCKQLCPQGIDIPLELKNFSEALSKIPSWAEVCRQRDEAYRKAAEAAKKRAETAEKSSQNGA